MSEQSTGAFRSDQQERVNDMANMGYCRFQNTVEDLRDCEESEGMYEPSVLSDEEKKARERLIALCRIVADVDDHE